jgi:DNA-binding NarL/FixJ family response regulator
MRVARAETPAFDVFIVAPNGFSREALVGILKGKAGLRIRGAGHFCESTLTQISGLSPDVVVLSLAWNDIDFRAAQEIHKAVPAVRILMIEMEDDEALFVKAVAAGATGYLLRDSSARDLLEAVRKLGQDRVACPEHLQRALFKFVETKNTYMSPAPEKILQQLTPREQKLLSLLSQGLTNKEIGTRLNLSEYTVKNHVRRILLKTGVPNRVALAHLASSQIYEQECGLTSS